MLKPLCIYRIRHIETGRSYIGWTGNIEQRWKRHRHLSGSKSRNAIHCALRKYGIDAFSFEVIEQFEGVEADARAREINWIAVEGTLSPGGYNMTVGGDGADDLGRLSAIATAKAKAADPEGFRAKRAEAQRRANEKMAPGARSEGARRMWAERPVQVRESHRQKCLAREAARAPEERARRARAAALTGSQEERSGRARKGAAALTYDQKLAAVAAMQAALTPERRSEIGKAGAAARTEKTTPEQRTASGLKRWANTSAEQRAAIVEKRVAAWATKSAEERADIARRRWEARRRNALLKAEQTHGSDRRPSS